MMMVAVARNKQGGFTHGDAEGLNRMKKYEGSKDQEH